MSKKKSTGSNITNKDVETISKKVIEASEVVLEQVSKEEKDEMISQKTEPSKEVRFAVAKEQGKVIGITETTVTLLLKNGSQKVVKKPNYPVKLRDMIDTTI